MRVLDRTNSELTSEIAALRVIASAVGDAEALAAELEARLAVVSQAEAERIQPQALLGMIERIVPADAKLTSIDWIGGELELQGRGTGPEDAAVIMEGLEASGCVSEVALRSVESGDFWITGRTVGPCSAPLPWGRDPFGTPLSQRPEAEVTAHPLVRWDVRDYAVTSIVPGETATLQDPDGGLHTIAVGSVVGVRRARADFITDDQVILAEEHVVDEETGKIESHIVTLRLAR